MSAAYQEAQQNSSRRKEKDIARHEPFKILSPVLEKGDRVLIRNMSERGKTGKMRSFWEEKVHLVVENINNENITNKVKSEFEFYVETCFYHATISLRTSTEASKLNLLLTRNRIRRQHLSNYQRKMIMRKKG